MKTVITYGTYDLLHYGHLRLLERAKALGDYLIVGVTADDFDKTRGKINVQQTLMERIEAVRQTGLADRIIVEEYEGQKIDDIIRYNVDIFTVGSDWTGKFDYLDTYCEVIYLDRTEGVSSSEIRAEKTRLRLGLVGETGFMKKYFNESRFVNGVEIAGVCTSDDTLLARQKDKLFFTDSYGELLAMSDAMYIASHPSRHYEQIKTALEHGKHVLCESPIAMSESECKELFEIAKRNGLVLMDAIKTAYSTAYNRMLLQLKSGMIGQVLSVDATCTSLKDKSVIEEGDVELEWNSICAWGPTAMLPIFQILGINYNNIDISSLMLEGTRDFDLFTRISFSYRGAVATVKVGKGVKSEGELVVSGTKGYIYVPAPWWKTDYFEVRYEHQEKNRRYFYQLDGEGIRYELYAFMMAIRSNSRRSYISDKISCAISKVIEKYENGKIYKIEPERDIK